MRVHTCDEEIWEGHARLGAHGRSGVEAGCAHRSPSPVAQRSTSRQRTPTSKQHSPTAAGHSQCQAGSRSRPRVRLRRGARADYPQARCHGLEERDRPHTVRLTTLASLCRALSQMTGGQVYRRLDSEQGTQGAGHRLQRLGRQCSCTTWRRGSSSWRRTPTSTSPYHSDLGRPVPPHVGPAIACS